MSQEGIAEVFDIKRKQVGNVIDGNNSKITKITENYEPYIYNIWAKLEGNDTDHFGSFPHKTQIPARFR